MILLQRSFDPFLNQIEKHLVFESSLYLNQRFFKEIKLDEYSFVTRFNFKELYLLIHQYKFTSVKHCPLLDFQT